MSGSNGSERAPRAITYPYRRIEWVPFTESDGPDPYGNPDARPAWMDVDWRSHVRGVEIGGQHINYAEIGEGPPIVFVHGLGGSWQNWLENMPAMAARGHRAIALDLPGFGSSPMPEGAISIPAYAKLVGEFCAALDVEGCTLVGNSMGGFIAAAVAVDEPTWVQRLVLVSAAGISHATMRKQPIEVAARMTVAANPILLRLNMPAMRRPGLRKVAFGGIVRHPLQLRPELLLEQMVNGFAAPGVVPAAVALTGYDLLDRLERIHIPTLIVWGRDDLVVPASDAAGYAERIRGSELVVFDDCGHVAMLERPVRFNRLLAEFTAAS
ncbi:MAG: alpha/beta fold hydrolase [Solirubrobacterales bacterium]